MKKQQQTYAIKPNGKGFDICKLVGKTYVKIKDEKEIETAKKELSKALGFDAWKGSVAGTFLNKALLEQKIDNAFEKGREKAHVVKSCETVEEMVTGGNAKKVWDESLLTQAQKDVAELKVEDAKRDFIVKEWTITTEPTKHLTALDSILVNMERNNDVTRQAMVRIDKVLDKVCQLDYVNSEIPRDTPINTIQKLQYENLTHVYINDRLERIAAHMEENF